MAKLDPKLAALRKANAAKFAQRQIDFVRRVLELLRAGRWEDDVEVYIEHNRVWVRPRNADPECGQPREIPMGSFAAILDELKKTEYESRWYMFYQNSI